MKKASFIFVIALMFTLSLHVSTFAAEEVQTPTWYEKVNYVALGDSLAFGINEQNGIGRGYPEFVAEYLLGEHVLNSFSNGYTFPGYTTTDVLTKLRANAPRLENGINLAQLPTGTLDAVREADIITITAGANDLLRHVSQTEAGISVDLPALLTTQQQVARNYTDILTTIADENATATVYVMGYYNAFAHVPQDAAAQVDELMRALNATIEQAATANGAVFVPTAAAIDENSALYLPNPTNIHVSEAGQRVLAAQFIEAIQQTYAFTSTANMIAVSTSPTTVDLLWEPPTHVETIDSYNVYVNDELVETVARAKPSFTVTNLKPHTRYTFHVTFTNAEGNESNQRLRTWELTVSLPDVYAFTDITQHGDRFYIDRAAHMHLVDGYEDNTYRPSNNVTRAQMVKMLVGALQLEHNGEAPFRDIANYAQQTQHDIAAAYEAGLIQGIDGEFRPNAPVTRAQLALMMARAYTYVTGETIAVTPHTFSDTTRYDDEAQQAIQFLYDAQIISGWEGRYMPTNATMRSHAAKVAVNFVDAWMK